MRYNRPKRMRARRAGTCPQCNQPIEPGDDIYWSRQGGAWHVNCETAQLRHTVCTVCGGNGCTWNGTPCRSCDGTGSRDVQEEARRPDKERHPAPDHCGVEDACCGDTAYEDACARACGLD